MDTHFDAFLKFLKDYPSIQYKKGEVLLRPQDRPQGIFVIQKGYVKLHAVSRDGEELTLIIFQPNDFFPMYWAFTDLTNKYYFEAFTPVEVKRMPKDVFMQLLKDRPEVLIEITSRIMVRLGGLLNRMEYLAFGSAKSRIASILLILAERFGKTMDHHVEIACPLTQKDIANLIGITRETTSTIMSSFLRKNYISYRGRHIAIKNRAGLLQESMLEG